MILRAQAIGRVAYDYLVQRNTWTVHSIFNKGFNIITKNNQLIFIGTTENGTFPFGIVVDRQTRNELLAQIVVGQEIKVGYSTLEFNSAYQLFWRLETILSEHPPHNQYLEDLTENITTFDFSEYEDSDFDFATMRRFINALTTTDKMTVEQMLRYVIGRGQGLTPTGDDILTGILFIHSIQPYIETLHLETLRQLLDETLTTRVSETFLHCALNGLFSSKVKILQDEPFIVRLNQLLEVGSSSGKDTLYGIYISLTLRSETYG